MSSECCVASSLIQTPLIYAVFKQRLSLFKTILLLNREAFLLSPDAAGRIAQEKWPELSKNLSIN